MTCPYCKNEMRIVASAIVLEGDNTPAEQTKVFNQQTLACKNPKCTAAHTAEVLHLLNAAPAESE